MPMSERDIPMTDFDLLEDFLVFHFATEGDRKTRGGEFCDRCGVALEFDPQSGEERCPECDGGG